MLHQRFYIEDKILLKLPSRRMEQYCLSLFVVKVAVTCFFLRFVTEVTLEWLSFCTNQILDDRVLLSVLQNFSLYHQQFPRIRIEFYTYHIPYTINCVSPEILFLPLQTFIIFLFPQHPTFTCSMHKNASGSNIFVCNTRYFSNVMHLIVLLCKRYFPLKIHKLVLHGK